MKKDELEKTLQEGLKASRDVASLWRDFQAANKQPVILIVDDEKPWCELCAKALRQLKNCEIHIEHSGFAAIRCIEFIHAQKRQVDLILLDLKMPKNMGDGLWVINHLDLNNYPVLIVVTGISDSDEDMVSAIKAGAKIIIKKENFYNDIKMLFSKF